MDLFDFEGDRLRESWSDAARKAAAAGRKARGQGVGVRRQIIRKAFSKASKNDPNVTIAVRRLQPGVFKVPPPLSLAVTAKGKRRKGFSFRTKNPFITGYQNHLRNS